jgi:UDP-N-acetylmuramate dehydrogenase
MVLRENIPLAPLTTLGVGGPARYLAEAGSEAEVREAVEFARSRNLPLFVLGGGSNVVVSDVGFAGLVLKIAPQSSSQDGDFITAYAGCDWDAFVKATVEAGYAGLECLSGIPGTVGATPMQNVGAYGQDVSQTIAELRALDLQSGSTVTISNADCGFGYRSSAFNTTKRGRYIILAVSFRLRPGGEPSLKYPDLQRFFADHHRAPTLLEVRNAVREIRHRKAMLIVPGEDDSRSVGSFFKNPILAQEAAEDLSTRLRGRGLDLPSYSAGDGYRKISAAWLVEHAGFAKGYSRGNAGISSKHALAVVNRGGATAAEIMALKDEIQSRVREEFGIDLQPEPVFVGFDAHG